MVLDVVGSNPIAHPCDLSGHRNDPEPALGFGVFRWRGVPRRAAGGLVVGAGVEGELASPPGRFNPDDGRTGSQKVGSARTLHAATDRRERTDDEAPHGRQTACA